MIHHHKHIGHVHNLKLLEGCREGTGEKILTLGWGNIEIIREDSNNNLLPIIPDTGWDY